MTLKFDKKCDDKKSICIKTEASPKSSGKCCNSLMLKVNNGDVKKCFKHQIHYLASFKSEIKVCARNLREHFANFRWS